MKITEMEPMTIPPAVTDLVFNLLFAFIVMTCILAAGMGTTRELNLKLPELDKGMAEERRSAAVGAIEVCILRSGRIVADGRSLGAARELAGVVGAGRPVVLALEKGAAGELLIAVEAELKKLGVREVTVLVKEAI